MSDDDFDIEDDLSGDDILSSGRMHWLPRVVVAVTVFGFIALAWYAYKTGTQSVSDDDLVVVEADKTPVKEKPEDPGGMKFPNQDKTVFETFAGNTVPPKVERVMPAPEEPIQKHIDMSETKSWVNEDLHKKEAASGKTEQLMGDDEAAPTKPLVKDVAKELANTPTAVVAPVQKPSQAAPSAGNDVVSYSKTPQEKMQMVVVEKPGIVEKTAAVAAPEKPVDVGVAEVKTAAKPVPEAKPFTVVVKTKTEAKAAPAAKASASNVKVQLGAYQSETEAKDAFVKLRKKFSSLTGHGAVIVKADLGAKGVFYRLRVGGFASEAEAKKFCGGLSAKGQACIIAK
jgi:hypothetical protein